MKIYGVQIKVKPRKGDCFVISLLPFDLIKNSSISNSLEITISCITYLKMHAHLHTCVSGIFYLFIQNVVSVFIFTSGVIYFRIKYNFFYYYLLFYALLMYFFHTVIVRFNLVFFQFFYSIYIFFIFLFNLDKLQFRFS